MMQFREVGEKEFFATVGKLDVHPYPTGDYPYVTFWKSPRTHQVFGRSEGGGYRAGSAEYAEEKYFVARMS